jgi:DNA-binding transcriptional MerR regulator
MSVSTLSIGEVAARTGRSLHAIRWYESQGLLPGVFREEGGRRRYTAQHVAWLELMDRLRLTGMSIAQMREFTELVESGEASLQRRHDLLVEHRRHVHETSSGRKRPPGLQNDKLPVSRSPEGRGRLADDGVMMDCGPGGFAVMRRGRGRPSGIADPIRLGIGTIGRAVQPLVAIA